MRETFTLPSKLRRAKARELIDEFPTGGYMTIVEKWRLTVRRLRRRQGRREIE